MTKGVEFTKMAEKREEEASQLSEIEIYVQIVKNTLNMPDMPIEFKVNMLLEALGDSSNIVTAIKIAMEDGIVDQELGRSALDLLKSS